MEKEIKMRICSCCGEEKSLEENFFKNKNSREGHLTECKKCFKQKSSKYADTRRESAKIKRREQGIKPKTTFSSEEERKHAHNKAVQKWNCPTLLSGLGLISGTVQSQNAQLRRIVLPVSYANVAFVQQYVSQKS